ncbi:hypothetical protein J5X98_13185 [Leptothermofonsia sichuanensis E412]|uniref:CHAT domain-containing protein n=1 Tax=Leptothermofonsia sichuanensis TaxID=2917832 RepID=UPI001CA76EA2|nr:CHAT domain-containing protein [Leptothermofonsia sichuanensis]QZZ23201.1 hypothetical protein J5X98_13185 [Leptothermofonsia sichuanensis E412]
MTWLLRWQDQEEIPTTSDDAMRQLLLGHRHCLVALADRDLLTVGDIYVLDPSLQTCQLVSLASCETVIAGDQTIITEYVGIVRAFLSHKVSYVLSDPMIHCISPT